MYQLSKFVVEHCPMITGVPYYQYILCNILYRSELSKAYIIYERCMSIIIEEWNNAPKISIYTKFNNRNNYNNHTSVDKVDYVLCIRPGSIHPPCRQLVCIDGYSKLSTYRVYYDETGEMTFASY